MRSVLSSVILGALLFAMGPARTASAWELFRSKNEHVERGNVEMEAERYDEALAAYEQAARSLPNEGGVHLDRGLALLAKGELGKAREALRLAASPPASDSVRAAAHYNTGLTFHHAAEAAAEADDHQEAQRLFREAADAYRRSLRAQPGNRDAGWNLELALRRILEEKAEQEKKDQENEDEREEEQGDSEEQSQDPDDGDGEDGDRQEPNDGSEGKPEEKPPGGENDTPPQDTPGSDEPEDGSGSPEERRDPSEAGDSAPREAPNEPKEDLPEDVAKVLDALDRSEDSYQRHRARTQAARERRRTLKDW